MSETTQNTDPKAEKTCTCSAEIASIKKANEALEARISSLEETISELLEAKDKPAAKSQAPETTGLKGHIFKNGKEDLRLKFPSFVFEGKEVTEDTLLIDVELQKKVFKQSPGLFVKA